MLAFGGEAGPWVCLGWLFCRRETQSVASPGVSACCTWDLSDRSCTRLTHDKGSGLSALCTVFRLPFLGPPSSSGPGWFGAMVVRPLCSELSAILLPSCRKFRFAAGGLPILEGEAGPWVCSGWLSRRHVTQSTKGALIRYIVNIGHFQQSTGTLWLPEDDVDDAGDADRDATTT